MAAPGEQPALWLGWLGFGFGWFGLGFGWLFLGFRLDLGWTSAGFGLRLDLGWILVWLDSDLNGF